MTRIHRLEPVGETSPLPEPDPARPDRVIVDTTWGTLQPVIVADGVRTVGELEVIEHLEAGHPVIDSRSADQHQALTLPGAASLPHTETVERRHELDPDMPSILFCNGPQCGQSPAAIRALLAAGHRPELIWYYRGGLHDWMTLGLPTVSPAGRPVPGA